jgi:tetraacyldisaccharide 4'-kinase
MTNLFAARLAETWRRDGIGAWMLAPAGRLFGAGVALRNALYDRGVLRTHRLGLPTVSVGNLSVGGTGKTPVTAWVAGEFAARGVRPAILLRGYRGEDETLVHRELTPRAEVVADPDRVRGADRARAAGVQVLILDDGFQHRRAARDVDVVLVAAEDGAAHRLLPAGPLREGRSALARAQVLVVTRKVATQEEAADVATAWSEGHDHLTIVVAELAARELVAVHAEPGAPPARATVASLAGKRVCAISGVGAPASFERQLMAQGAMVPRVIRFADHHAYTERDVARLVGVAQGTDAAVCTLKDAVKLRGRWPRGGPPLWYLSQAVRIEWGAEEFGARLARVAAPPTD